MSNVSEASERSPAGRRFSVSGAIRINPIGPCRFQVVSLQSVAVFDLVVARMGWPALENFSRDVDQRLIVGVGVFKLDLAAEDNCFDFASVAG